MTRVIQAAGRIIRTETDRGLILLIDPRFAQSPYCDLLPRDWYEIHPGELIHDDFRKTIRNFWDNP